MADPMTFTTSELAEQLAAERDGDPFLVLRGEDGRQRVRRLEGDRLTVGRDPGSDLALDWDENVSRLHALMERLGGSWTVADGDMSRNGTFVNEARVQGRRRLHDRDVLRFAETLVIFRDPSAPAHETPFVKSQGGGEAVTPAQRRVLVALCAPLLQERGPVSATPSNQEIADSIHLSVESVRSHLKTLFRVFEIPSLPQYQKRTELARRALNAGVITPRDDGPQPPLG
jgi:pSer/pThr/pTyr-binding forkhead associated (FHA) protein